MKSANYLNAYAVNCLQRNSLAVLVLRAVAMVRAALMPSCLMLSLPCKGPEKCREKHGERERMTRYQSGFLWCAPQGWSQICTPPGSCFSAKDSICSARQATVSEMQPSYKQETLWGTNRSENCCRAIFTVLTLIFQSPTKI